MNWPSIRSVAGKRRAIARAGSGSPSRAGRWFVHRSRSAYSRSAARAGRARQKPGSRARRARRPSDGNAGARPNALFRRLGLLQPCLRRLRHSRTHPSPLQERFVLRDPLEGFLEDFTSVRLKHDPLARAPTARVHTVVELRRASLSCSSGCRVRAGDRCPVARGAVRGSTYAHLRDPDRP